MSARPPSAAYTLQKLIRRHRVMFASAAVITGVLLLGAVVSTWQAVRATRAEREQSRQRSRAEAQELAVRRRAYAADMNLAQQALAVDNLGRARELLDRHRPKSDEPDLRGWEWRYLWQQCRSDASTLVCRQPGNVNDLAASADGRWLVVHANRNGVAGATRLVRDRVTGIETAVPPTNSMPIFSPREPLVAVAVANPPRMLLWNVETGRSEREWARPPGAWIAHRFSADGTELLAVFRDGIGTRWCRWRVADGQPFAHPPPVIDFPALHSSDGHGVAVTPDLRRAAVREHRVGGGFTMVDVEAGEKLWTMPPGSMADKLAAFALAPDASIGVSAAGEVKSVLSLWEGASGRKIGELRGHHGNVNAAVFSRDGATLVSAGSDQTIRIWDVASRRLLRTLRGHDRPVMTLVLLPDGRTLFSGANGGEVRAWDLAQESAIPARISLPDKVVAWRFAEDGKSILLVEAAGDVTQRSGRDFDAAVTIMKLPPGVRLPTWGGMAMAPDAPRFAVSAGAGTIQVWDWERKAMWRELAPGTPLATPKVFLDRGSKLLIFAGVQKGSSAIREWDLERGAETRTWPAERAVPFHFDDGGFAALSADEGHFLLLDALGNFMHIDLAAGTRTETTLALPTPSGLQLSADGQHFVVPSVYNSMATIWDARRMRAVATVPAYVGNVAAVAFSPDSRRLMLGGVGAEGLRLLDVMNWEPVLTVPAPSYLVTAAFSADGQTVGALGEDGMLHLWRAPSWAEIEAAEKEGRWR